MKDAQARTTYLKDYVPPFYLIETTHLHFNLFEDHAIVSSQIKFVLNSESSAKQESSLVLHGQHLVLEKLSINGIALAESEYATDDESLTIYALDKYYGDGDSFLLHCQTRIEPQNNTALEGLYKSKTMFCTQCEAEGFRRITYYLDRPDVMASFTTEIEADKTKYPVLLSNGNKIASGLTEHDDNRHWVKWEDPFKKPSYLFALVAGDLLSLDDSFTTASGREIELKIFVEEKDIDKCDHAMVSLKNSMRWDEEQYGREYDLDIFMIVAVDDFNMGAMENKGLNIFNTSCVLANPKTQTDLAFQRVEAVVAHEYFHNWTGNRVTCRDWFQLSLKEGFTVFRDSEFSADMGSRTVKRVEDVSFLRTVQFAEDSGPMAHSVRPDSYMEISNFYTVTIYEKGAEVVRMIQLLVGVEGFRKGADLYFERHDGQAVTTEDFVKSMEDANQIDLSQFRRWYSQAGTPVVDIETRYDSTTNEYYLTAKQSCPDTPGQSGKEPFHIPLRLGLLDRSGEPLILKLVGESESSTDRVLDLKQAEQTFIFTDVKEEPIPSLLRSFSAPVRLNYEYSDKQLFFLMTFDNDGFNRWNAAQLLSTSVIQRCLVKLQNDETLDAPEVLVRAFAAIIDKAIDDQKFDKAMAAQLLTLPALSTLIEQAEIADVDGLYAVREFLLDTLASSLKEKLEQLFLSIRKQENYKADADSIAGRSLRNLCLAFLARTGSEEWLDESFEQFSDADNMTNQLAAMKILVASESKKGVELASRALSTFYDQWQHEPLVVDQWFTAQALDSKEGALDRVKKLMNHEAFEIKNPNKVRSLIGAFCGQNHLAFHDESGSGYEFLAEQVLLLDQLNPQIASRLLTPLTRWRKFGAARQRLMQAQLLRIKSSEGLSKDVFEIVEKSTVI